MKLLLLLLLFLLLLLAKEVSKSLIDHQGHEEAAIGAIKSQKEQGQSRAELLSL